MQLDQETIAKVLTANYAAAAELLQGAAQQMAEAAKAAGDQQTNLAVGTAMGAECDLKRALALLQAAATIRSGTA